MKPLPARTATADNEPQEKSQRTRIWDLPIRVMHWSLVILFGLCWWTGETGRFSVHRFLGYTVLGIILYRLYWGFAGGYAARFAAFVRSPAAVWRYLRRDLPDRSHATAGHNPLGAWSVIAILAVLLLQVGTGLFAVDVDGIESGPLSHLVSFEAGRQLASLHHLSFDTLVVLLMLHITAIAFYGTYKRQNLVAPMITGYRLLSPSAVTHRDEPAPRWSSAVAIVIIVAVLYCIATGLPFLH